MTFQQSGKTEALSNIAALQHYECTLLGRGKRVCPARGGRDRSGSRQLWLEPKMWDFKALLVPRRSKNSTAKVSSANQRAGHMQLRAERLGQRLPPAEDSPALAKPNHSM